MLNKGQIKKWQVGATQTDRQTDRQASRQAEGGLKGVYQLKTFNVIVTIIHKVTRYQTFTKTLKDLRNSLTRILKTSP